MRNHQKTFTILLVLVLIGLNMRSLQAFLRSAGALGVWVYIFLERILIPTGLHHFVYGPFIFG